MYYQPGPDSVGIFDISHSCNGVAARACGLVSLEPTKIVEILKDRPAWLCDCRSLEVFSMLQSGNGGTIELVYTQMYAPTTLAPARDFWSLRYTTSLDNGSIVDWRGAPELRNFYRITKKKSSHKESLSFVKQFLQLNKLIFESLMDIGCLLKFSMLFALVL